MRAEVLRMYETSMLAVCIWREARGEGANGMRAVACVIRNRARAGWRGGSWVGNIVAPNQFTSMKVRGDNMLVQWPRPDINPRPLADVFAFEIADSFFTGDPPDITGGALYFRNPQSATSAWFEREIVQKPGVHPETARIGNHVFYA